MINVELTVQAAKSSVSMTLGGRGSEPVSLTARRPGDKVEEEVEKEKGEEEEEEEEEEEGKV